jgi:hypothetical protein
MYIYERTEENHVKSQTSKRVLRIRNEHLPNASLEHYHYADRTSVVLKICS